jgi:hypothetical protein
MHFKHIGQWMLAAMAACSLFSGAQEASDSVKAQPNQLSVDLQFLSRGEMRYGGLPNTTEEEENGEKAAKSNFAQSRTRLVINYKRDWLEARVTPQHSGVWGQAGKGAFNLYETWVKMTARNGLFAQVGRVALSYDDERIIGSDNWAMASQSHDVVRLGYEGHGHKAHVILAYNQNANVMNDGGSYYVGGAQPYKTMQDVWYHYDLPKFPLGVSVLFMNIGMQGDEDTGFRTYFQHLLGSYVSFTPKRWKAEAAYYHQFGKNEFGMKIDAWMASGKLTFSPKANYGFVGGFDYLSGDKLFAVPPHGGLGMVHHDVIRGFSTVYGSHHKFYGAMDFFYVSTYLNGFTPGLQNAYIGGFFSPMKGMRLDASYHNLATATKLVDMGMSLGQEFEFQASYAATRDIIVMAGASLMTGSETMERLKRDTSKSTLRWGWISLIVNPRIFSTKW